MFQAISIAAIVVLTAIDQLTKYAAVSILKPNGPKEFLFGLFQLRYAENTGAAFSSFSDNKFMLLILSGGLLLAVLFVLLTKKLDSKFVNVSLVLVCAGGLGNLIDRALNGYVVDFIEPLFIKFAVFNFADICITVGAFMLIGYEIFEIVRETKLKNASEKATEND